METTTPQSAVSEEPFELVVRLLQFQAESPLDGTLLRAQALVKDVLMSKLRVDAEVDAQENVRAQGLTDLGKVLAASRALQIAFEGFRDASSAGHTSVAIVLDSPPMWDPDISSISPPMQQTDLITSAKPSQVLITRPFYNRVPDSHSALRQLPMPGEVYEFLWTNEQKLHEMQAEAARMPILVQEPAQLTQMMEPVVPLPESVIPEPPVRTPDWHNSEVAREPETSGLDHGVGPRWLSGRRIFALTAGVVLVLLLGWLVHVLVAKPAPKPADTTVVTPAPTTPTSVIKDGSSKVGTNPPIVSNSIPPLNHSPRKTAATILPDVQAPAVTVSAPTSSTPPQAVVSPKASAKSHACAIDGPIPAFLKRAEADSSNGRYDSAIRRFTEILECEPGNREAALELRKAKDSQKYAP